MIDRLKSEIQRLTKRIGQAKRNGVTELAERLRISRANLAVRLAREFDLWLLVNPEGKSEFVDRETFRVRVEAWKARQPREGAVASATAEPPPSGEAAGPSAPLDPVREFFGEPIHVYTRRQALEDGVLVNVTPWAEGLFRCPVAFTAALWGIVEDVPPEPDRDAAIRTRTVEVLRAAAEAGRSAKDTDRVSFVLILGTRRELRTLDLLAVSGPGDRGELVVTIGFPGDF